ncbi:hypothetical protein [Campylobacter upsaliensis]|uniref:hypothetical protein n=1 Tax=Campylobacter upsaliensis TaxID=28080 RepID=UPI002B3D07F7|nr:hypothetical protein [Campylobacter upsaliensis]MEB2817703.1 hypothetical protein [Campylobacter upsaliensis]
MKKVILILTILSTLTTHQALACGGCRDAHLGGTEANKGKSNYDRGEALIEASIEKLNALIKNETLKSEENSLKENHILVALKKDEALNLKYSSFLLQRQSELLSIIANIEAQ